MDLDRFWQLVKESRSAHQEQSAEAWPNGNMDRQAEALGASLARLSAPEVLAFRRLFDERLIEAYTWELWGAAYLLGEGYCSDDWFLYFRAWLLAMGREVYEQAVADPDSLAERADDPAIEDVFFEQFLYVPDDVLKKKTGEVPTSTTKWPDALAGNDWQEDKNMLAIMLPRLWQWARRIEAGSKDHMEKSASTEIGAIYKVESSIDGRRIVFIGSAMDLKRRLAAARQRRDEVLALPETKVSAKRIYAALDVGRSRRKTIRNAISEALRAAESEAQHARR